MAMTRPSAPVEAVGAATAMGWWSSFSAS